MNQALLLRGLFAGIMGLVFAWTVFSRYDHEVGSEITDSERQKYLPYLSPILLPVFLLTLILLSAKEYGFSGAAKLTLSFCFSVFTHICLYYLVLLLILPFLRKHISARACAMLWLLPNFLYIMHQNFMMLPSPLIVIPVNGNWIWILLGIWFVGFVAVLVHKFTEHFIFRRQLLRQAHPVTDPVILEVWDRLVEDAKFKKPKFQLMQADCLSTPLTIGLTNRSTRVVLPKYSYTQEELAMILQHELIHIGRMDAWNKFFMVFCTAMCWFNPLMWIAMRKSADDLELSCDETVLLAADDATRKQYAHLLLDAAGDERGFTTRLSTTATALRYRLQNITKPRKRHCGAIVVGTIFFVLCMTCGYISLAFDRNTGAQMLYQRDHYTGYSIQNIYAEDRFHTQYDILDEAAFHDYLAGLTVYQLTGNYSYRDSQRCYRFLMDTPSGTQVFILYDSAIQLVRLHHTNMPVEYYYIPGGLDWAYIDRIVVPKADSQ